MTENLEILITEHMRALTSETLTKNREVLITEHSENVNFEAARCYLS